MFLGLVEPVFRVMESSNNIGVILISMALIPSLYVFRGLAIASFVYITMLCLRDLLKSRRHPIVSCLILSVNFAVVFLMSSTAAWILVDLGAFYMVFKLIRGFKAEPYEPINKYAIRKHTLNHKTQLK